MTLQCVPAHRLTETTKATTTAAVRAPHAGLLRDHKHVRYMWIPYTDQVVVVMSDPSDSPAVKQHPKVYVHACVCVVVVVLLLLLLLLGLRLCPDRGALGLSATALPATALPATAHPGMRRSLPIVADRCRGLMLYPHDAVHPPAP